MSARDLLAAATPRPWMIGALHQVVRAEDQHYIADATDADSDLIVAAVNEYEPLLDLEALLRRLVRSRSFTDLNDVSFREARAALDRLDAIRAPELSPENTKAVGTPEKSAPTASTEGV